MVAAVPIEDRKESMRRRGRDTSLMTGTEIGKVWAKRLRASEAYFKAHSYDWAALEKLYQDPYNQRSRASFGISLAWAIIQNLVIDAYTRNPEPMIVSLQQQARPDLDRQLRDLFKAIHRDTDIEGVMKRAMALSHIHGMAGVWSYHEQHDDPFGNAIRQRFCHEEVPSIDLRHDPNGSRWDLYDHQWVARIYTRPLQWFVNEWETKEERSGFTEIGIRRLSAWAKANRTKRRPNDSRYSYADQARYNEDDPAYIPVSAFEIWTRADFQVIHMPVGADFEFGMYDWPVEWREANFGTGEFPLTIVAFNKRLPTDSDPGFYAQPTLRMIRKHLVAINKTLAKFDESTSISLKKYIALKGLLGDDARSQLQSETPREIIEIDISKLRKVFPSLAQDFGSFDIEKILKQLKQEDMADAQRWLLNINQHMEMIREIIGQGSAARGGVAEAESATATLTIAKSLAARSAEMAEQAAKIIDRIDEKTYYLMKGCQSLPIPYQLSTSRGKEVWSFFPPEILDGVQLVFSHRNGSTRARDRDTVKADLQQLLTLTMPVLADMGMKREIKTLMREMLRVLDLDVADGLFEDEIPQLVQVVMEILNRVSTPEGGLDSTDPRVGAAFVQAVAQLCSALASPGDVQQIADKELEGLPAAPAARQRGRGSLPSPSTGTSAYGAAAAGSLGGMKGVV